MVTAVQISTHAELADCRKIASLTVGNPETVSKATRIMIFKIDNLLIGLGSLMICTHDLTIFTKTKETIHYCELFGYSG
jgi:hypothetical protein